MNVDVSPSPPIQGIVDGLGGYATVDASGRYGSVCRVDLGDPVMVSERDQERSALGPDLLKYERRELLRVSKRIKTKSASRAKQLALRTRAAAAAAVAASKQQKDAGANSTTTTAAAAAVAQRSTAISGGVAQHPKRSSGARLQHARMLERYGDLTRLSLETQSELEDSDGRIQRLLKRRSALSEQRVQIDREVTALQRKMREIVAASMVEAAARTTTTTASVDWHPYDETLLAVASADNTVSLWDMSVEADDDEEAQGGQGHLEGEEDYPAQMMFLHQGQTGVKEVKFHPQLPGVMVTTALDGFNVFKTCNID
ncbi:glutamate rich WD-repeat protein, putative [Perkinsus marinus ATCC 50983]|uniref:Glutamate rich WD-repeat protein, putative n=1 Tax=Perkinsus marinus (strain ATCC 50983 / TXsc) TaxID=423536 RepID=C5KXX2_PERM5|nr:glutamate rich WD-repeat protein, putative [Perkinsus marinus ATCC 50983]EER10846.1 glutamate rich WD-repeat protein, putative [Perkinsus marinus ATCC 50983]|eukprot:XP_002779051.1 glutamate rich WD-repeat protein, putative [Perkinsus marinus ATCC 50983]